MLHVEKQKTFLCAVLVLFIGGIGFSEDLYLNDGGTYQIDYYIDGSIWIENAYVGLYNPAHITGFAITGSAAVLDIYGGQIDYMLLVSTSENGMPDGVVTVYGSDFAVDGVPVEPDTPELFLTNQVLSGKYEDGTPFATVVDCAISGNATYLHYQTVKLGWVVSEPRIQVSASELHFGQIDIGSAANQYVTILNAGNANLTIDSLAMMQDEPVQFGFTPWQVIPVTLEPGASIELEVIYAPAIEGLASAVLQIASSDPTANVTQISLSGTGVLKVLTPAQQSAAIISFLEEGLTVGTIAGQGKGNSAVNKAAAFYKMVNTACNLIDAGYYGDALDALNYIEKKCDGQGAPADFVGGQDAAVLHSMIAELIEQLSAN